MFNLDNGRGGGGGGGESNSFYIAVYERHKNVKIVLSTSFTLLVMNKNVYFWRHFYISIQLTISHVTLGYLFRTHILS